jgi:HAD superfamily hydrolase (TIGR01509 family)
VPASLVPYAPSGGQSSGRPVKLLDNLAAPGDDRPVDAREGHAGGWQVIRGLIFDFDGFILETEEPDFRSWQELYTEHGCALAFEQWAPLIGTAAGHFDAYAELERQLGRSIDRAAIRARRRARFHALVEAADILPGVLDYLEAATRLHLRLAVASSSTHAWVDGHLARLGLAGYFATTACADDVAQTKPDPALYELALERLGLGPTEVIALEDSPNGVAAAKAAGLYCVVVPNVMTRGLPLAAADLRLDSLADLPLPALLDRVQTAIREQRSLP